jgi:hypothetical protein
VSRGKEIDRRKRAAMSALRRPEVVVPFNGRGRTQRSVDEQSGTKAGGAEGRDPAPTKRLSAGESLLMVAAALRVIIPYVLIIVLAVFGAWGVWRLLF